jgi:hypothetical protein
MKQLSMASTAMLSMKTEIAVYSLVTLYSSTCQQAFVDTDLVVCLYQVKNLQVKEVIERLC